MYNIGTVRYTYLMEGMKLKRKYSDQFKLKVVQEYYQSSVGVRTIANKYGLPSKNYVNNWEKELIRKGLLPENSTKPKKAVARTVESIVRKDIRTEREKMYEDEIQELRAKIEYYESLEEYKPFVSEKKTKSKK